MSVHGEGEDGRPGGFASPPCLMHELDPTFGRLHVDPQQEQDVARWRKAARERLVAARLAIPAETRRGLDRGIVAGLDALLGDVRGRTVAAYWPFRAEPDLRGWLGELIGRGAACALPVVVAKGAPLAFRPWRPGAPLVRGVWNIMVPAEGPEVTPDILFVPVVGFDPWCYRLGYGGGFYDVTLAALPKGRRAIGVGYAIAALATIFPQPHDVPLDAVVTPERVVHAPALHGSQR
jgi:5-formyltetrahydrofolate cyclo-ligase